MIERRTFLQILTVAAIPPEQIMQSLKELAQASGWTIPESRTQEIATIYKGIADDTELLRQLDLGDSVPAITFEAE